MTMRECISIRDRLVELSTTAPADAALQFPDDGLSIDYATLTRDVSRTVRLLESIGVKRGDRVAMLLPNCYETVLIWYACDIIGAIECPLNFFADESVLSKQIEMLDPTVVFATEGVWTPLLSATVPARTHLLQDDSPTSFYELIGDLTGPSLSAIDLSWQDESDPVVIFGTSGTTGVPKGAMLSRRNATETARTWIKLTDATSDDVLFNPLSLWHGNTQFMTVLGALELGTSAVIPRKFSASRFWSQVAETGTTTVNYHASMLGILLKRGIPEDVEHRVRILVGGGCDSGTIDRWTRATGVEVLELYGLTEYMLSLSNPRSAPKPDSCGPVTWNFEARVVDDHDHPVSAGEAGELLLRPKYPYCGLLGYWNDDAATVKANRNLWFHTGDIVVMDDDGYVFFKDRKGDFIRISGENVASRDIETVAMSCDWVEEAAAVGVRGEFADEVVKLLVVPRAEPDIDDLVVRLERNLPKYAVPRYLEVRDALPLNSSQRVRKGLLRGESNETAIDLLQRRKGREVT